MSGIGFTELILIAAVLLIFMGPKQMVSVLRVSVKWWFQTKRFFEKIRQEIFDTPEIRKMIAEIKHEVYGEGDNTSSIKKSKHEYN